MTLNYKILIIFPEIYIYIYIYNRNFWLFIDLSPELATLLSFFFKIKLFLFSPNLTMSETFSL